MANDTTPKFDARSVDTIADQTGAMLVALTDGAWTPQDPAGEQDPLGALVRVFADMAGQVIDGINAVPDAGFAAFLKLIGAEGQRPAAARAPLTFRLADGAPADATVPAGTMIGAAPADDDKDPDPIVFETESELVVTRATLLGTYAHVPATDRLDRGPAPLPAFAARNPGVHDLLIACPAVLGRPGARSWTVALELEAAAPDLQLTWIGDQIAGAPPYTIAAASQWAGNTLTVKLADPPTISPTQVLSRVDSWLTARLATGPNAPAAVPRLKKVTLSAQFVGADLPARKVIRGATQLDAVTDFYAFEAAPTLGSAFALDGGEAFAQPAGASLEVFVTRAAAVDSDTTRPIANTDLRVAWELLQSDGAWLEVGRSSGTSPAVLVGNKNPYAFVDDTYALTQSGRVRFVLPFAPSEQRHAGKAGIWLRARIVQGAYKTDRAPIVGSLALGYSHTVAAVPAGTCVARDLGYDRDLGPVDGTAAPAVVFTRTPPGAPALGDRPALYLVFDRAFEQRPVHLWFAVPPPDPALIGPPDQLPPLGDEPRIAWEYLGPAGWTRLGVRDGTSGLRQRGLLQLVGPPDSVPAALFDRAGHWLRARWASGSLRVQPQVAAVVPNTIWASHSATRQSEVLGSGTGAPHQTFTLVASPVLAGERVEVREHAQPGERDLAALVDDLGDDAVTAERDDDGKLLAIWVRWTPVAHFRGSGPNDRHYVLDPDRGVVEFGDGLAGWPPPQGRSNVRATYATGGGPRGNRPAGAVAELKAAIAYVAGVTNLEAASGGTGREDPARMRARGPRRLRHRGRAVTVADLEDLAFEAAPEVARAHALTLPFNPIDVGMDLSAPGAATRDARGWLVTQSVPEDTSQVSQRIAEVRLVIVPHAVADQPAPSVGLIEHVEGYLRARAAPGMRLHVSGPRWIRVAVRAAIAARASAPADRLIAELRAAITRFLHPLTGGELGQGWDFARIPRRSHLYRLLARFPGVHHVEALTIVTDPPLPDASEPLTEPQRRALAGALVYSGAHELTLVGPAEDP